MAVLAGATANARMLYNGTPSTSLSTVYTAPAYNSNVTTPSATAIIKEITLCNISGVAATVTIDVNGSGLFASLTINPNDTKIFSGMNTMIPAGGTIQAQASATTAISVTISGQEFQ